MANKFSGFKEKDIRKRLQESGEAYMGKNDHKN